MAEVRDAPPERPKRRAARALHLTTRPAAALLRAARRQHHDRRPPPGSAPGVLVSAPEAVASKVRLFAFGPDSCVERSVEHLPHLDQLCRGKEVVWIDVQGLGDLELIRAVGERFHLHPLALADVVHAHQRPKVEAYDEHLFIVGRMPHFEDAAWSSEQLSIILGQGFVLTFQERPGDCFGSVRERIRKEGSRLRLAGADYLAYALIDALIDGYFPILEHYGEVVEAVEQEVVGTPDAMHVSRIHELKRDLLELRRAIWPLREVVSILLREETPFIQAGTRLFLRDCADHVFQLMDMLEIDREVASGLMDLHISSVSMRMNEVMKVLTIIATIFIPLGFIAGVYGMNFDRDSPFNMPELGWTFGYPFALGLMAAVAGGLLVYFRRKGWLGL
jgi:magnesium transporter